jgi:hypothetical protein
LAAWLVSIILHATRLSLTRPVEHFNLRIALAVALARHPGDPNFERDKHHEIEYEFSGRWFHADRSKRGAYANY